MSYGESGCRSTVRAFSPSERHASTSVVESIRQLMPDSFPLSNACSRRLREFISRLRRVSACRTWRCSQSSNLMLRVISSPSRGDVVEPVAIAKLAESGVSVVILKFRDGAIFLCGEPVIQSQEAAIGLEAFAHGLLHRRTGGLGMRCPAYRDLIARSTRITLTQDLGFVKKSSSVPLMTPSRVDPGHAVRSAHAGRHPTWPGHGAVGTARMAAQSQPELTLLYLSLL